MTDDELMNQGCVALNLRRVTRIVTRKYEDALRPFALTSFQMSLLKALTDHPGAPQSALAKGFGMDISTMNRNVQPMVKRGLVVVTPDKQDQRIKRMEATDEGHDLFRAAMPHWAEVQRSLLGALGEGEWPKMKEALNSLRK